MKPKTSTPTVTMRKPPKLLRIKGNRGSWTFYTKTDEMVRLTRGMVITEDAYPEIHIYPDQWEWFKGTIPEWIRNNPTASILWIRTFAMGDVIQVVPALRELGRKFPGLRQGLATRPQFAALLRRIEDIQVIKYVEGALNSEWDIVINVDGILERDHDPAEPASRAHRVHQYLSFVFGIPMPSFSER